MAGGSTANRVMQIATPLDPDVLLFHEMHAREQMSRLSEYQVSLLSPRSDVDLNELLGKSVSVTLALPDDSAREFNGYVTRFAQRGMRGRYYHYTATVSPWLWFLTRTSDCRIFQEMTVPQIVDAVFVDHPAEYAWELTGEYRTWPYCVQYRETDFNFVSRLLEHEGIAYYFTHKDRKNRLVLTDSLCGHEVFPDYATLPFISPERLVRPDIEHIDAWELSRQVQPGAYAHRDYDLERPSVNLLTTKRAPRPHAQSEYELFDYPGQYFKKDDGEQYAAVRIEECSTQFETVEATTNARGVAVGCLLNVVDHPRQDQNRELLITAARYDLEFSDYESMPDRGGADYRCGFEAIPTTQQFRPQRRTPKPFVQGPQTAVVVGPSGDEIHTDKYGRVKVQFHWDRYGTRDENSSCFIRVSQPWAGKGWGSVSTPRIGQEVIVDFLEGDPDQPIVTGRVYNGECQPPFGFPEGAVVSGIKSATHKGAGFNEISMNDTAGNEAVTIHAQHDMTTTVEHDQSVTVNEGNRAMTVKAGTLTDVVKGTASLTVQAGSRTVSVTGGDYSGTASGAVVLHGKGAGVQVTGDASGVTVKGTGGTGIGINGTPNVEVTAAALAATEAPAVTIKGGASCAVESPLVTINAKSTGIFSSPIIDIGDGVITIHGQSIVLMAGGSAIEIGAAGVTINGSSVNVSGGTVNVLGSVVKIN
jgi:type VI secretion system secreted protein VgrG